MTARSLLSIVCATSVVTGLPAPAQTRTGYFAAADSARLYYEECGAGPSLVLLHDGLLHSVTWDQVWPRLCARFHVLRYDRRGMGRSNPPTRPFVATEDLTALLADRALTSATLVGSSSGAGLAIDYAFRHPDKVDRLVLIGPVVHGMASSEHFLARGARNGEPLARGDVRAAAANWANDPYQIAVGHDEARRTLRDALVAAPQDLTYQGNLELRFAVPAATRMAEIRAPALILVGEADIPDVQAYAGAVELGVWGARREVIRDAGHLVQLERPDFLVQRIDDFVRNTPVFAVTSERLQGLAGAYNTLMYGRPGEFLVANGRLTVRIATERDLPLFPSSDSTFYAIVWNDGIRFTFHRDSTGRATSVDVIQRDTIRTAVRAPA